MVKKARAIGVRELHERLDVPDTKDELERSFKRLRQFSAAASHELRTPLSVMKGELEVTLRRRRGRHGMAAAEVKFSVDTESGAPSLTIQTRYPLSRLKLA